MRLDKYLSNMGLGSRKEVKVSISRKKVMVNDQLVRKSDLNIDPVKDKICYDGVEIPYRPFLYVMLNKPSGFITAKKDPKHSTVMELIKDTYGTRDLSPVGRLDKDTEGFLILTDDGNFNHEIMSPKKHVPKKYYVEVQGIVNEETINIFLGGMLIDQNERCLPSELQVIKVADSLSQVYVTLHEGKYHQVKRMFEAVDMKVLYLKRVQIGGLSLDENLEVGDHRLMTREEVNQILNLNTED